MTAGEDRGPEIVSVPPSPELEKRLLRTKERFLAGELLPKEATAELLDLQSFALISHLPEHTRAHTLAPALVPGPVIGPRRALVLLVDFQDKSASQSGDHYREMLFSFRSYPTGTLSDHYHEVSYQQLSILGEVRGWYRAPQPYSYYAGKKYGFGNYPRNAYKLAEDVVDLASGDVNFANYDLDEDGEVDALSVVHAGRGAEATGNISDIWSHMSSITPRKKNGVKVRRYSVVPEDGKIGVFSQTAAAHPAASSGACKVPPHKDSTRLTHSILSRIRMPLIPAATTQMLPSSCFRSLISESTSISIVCPR